MHGGGSAPSCCTFTHRVAFEEGSGPRVLLKSGPGLQYFGHLMQRTDSLEKILMLGKSEGRRAWGKALFQESVLNPLWLLHSWWLIHSLNLVCFQPGPELLLLLIPGGPQRWEETEVPLAPPSTPRM